MGSCGTAGVPWWPPRRCSGPALVHNKLVSLSLSSLSRLRHSPTTADLLILASKHPCIIVANDKQRNIRNEQSSDSFGRRTVAAAPRPASTRSTRKDPTQRRARTPPQNETHPGRREKHPHPLAARSQPLRRCHARAVDPERTRPPRGTCGMP